jgi:hypothetical protein
MARLRDDVAKIVCPYCRERVELFVDPETSGSFVEDCAVCCRPWHVEVSLDADGARHVEVAPAQ